MKREILSVLLGAALLSPAGVDAQRARGRNDDAGPRVQKLDPVTVRGRVAPRGPVNRVRHVAGPSRIVYSSGPTYRVPRHYRAYRDARFRIRFDWGPARLRIGAPRYLDRWVGPGELRRLLGPHTVNRIRRAGHRVGLRGAPRGHWIDAWRYGLVLVVTMDGRDVAEFVDYDRDGYIDDASFFRHEGGGRWVNRP